MQSLLRFTLLGTFGAIGVAIALCVASTLEPPADQAGPAADRPDPSRAASSSASTSPDPGDPLTFLGWEHAPSVRAPYHPGVASQIERLESAIQRAEQTTQQNVQAVRDALQAVPPGIFEAGGANVTAPRVPAVQEPADPSAAAGGAGTSGKTRVVKSEGDDQLVINVQNGDIREVLDLLSQQGGLNILASKNVQGQVSASLTNVTVEGALAAILKSTGFVARREGPFVYVGTQADLEQMDQAADTLATRVYRPNYARAAELEALVTPLLTPGIGKIKSSSAADVGITADSNKAGGDNFAGNEVLLVRDYRSVLARVDILVEEVDERPLQVAIEAMILSVKLGDTNDVGVDFEALRNHANLRLTSGSPLSNLGDIDLDSGGLKIGFLDGSLALFVRALETVGDTNVIASPRLLCLNKQRAEILIGSQKGYVSTTVTENAATQSVEFLEVGTQLRIRPYISADGMVRLEVHPELSTGEVKLLGGFTLPEKEVTQVTTNIMVHDGATVIIGGLIREDISTTTTQIPLLGSLPLVGPAFRQKKESLDRRELIVLLTPRIVIEPKLYAEGAQSQHDFLYRQSTYAEKMNPFAKRHYGRHYLRLAKAAWAAGDGQAALRYCNLAIHFDPQNGESTSLHDEIVANSPFGDKLLNPHLREGLAPWNHPSRHYERGYDANVMGQYFPLEAQPHEADPSRDIPPQGEPIDGNAWLPYGNPGGTGRIRDIDPSPWP